MNELSLVLSFMAGFVGGALAACAVAGLVMLVRAVVLVIRWKP